MGIRVVSLVTEDDVIRYGNEVQSELISNRAALVRNQFGSYLIPYLMERIGRLKLVTVQLPRYVLRYCFLAIADIRYPVEYSLYVWHVCLWPSTYVAIEWAFEKSCSSLWLLQ